jgi:AraC-like DNA-binding protein
MKILHQYHQTTQVLENNTVTFEPHLHAEVEIVVLFEGTASAHVGGKAYTLQAGDAVIVFPNTVHSYHSADEVKAGKFIFAPSAVPDLQNTFSAMAPCRPVVHTTSDFSRIAVDVLREYRHSSPIVRRAYLSLLAGKLLELCELEPQRYGRRDTLDSVLAYCQEHFRSELTLQTLSETLGISKSHLSHVFSGKIKMDFRNYVNMLRINHAYTLLSDTDLSMTEIAERCGFSGLRTFDRAFRSHNGISPTAYRQQLHRSSH